MRFYLIAGDPSGDHHGARLIQWLKKIDEDSSFRGVGGEQMLTSGLSLTFDMKTLAVMGFSEVLQKLIRLRTLQKICKQDVINYQPDLLVLIDSAGFNLPMAKFASNRGIKVCYFIPPKVWAWAGWRARLLARYVDHVISIFPFEHEYFLSKNIDSSYFGNPSVEYVGRGEENWTAEGSIALLPGSRAQEIKRHLPIMLQVAEALPEERFVVFKAQNLRTELFAEKEFPSNVSPVRELIYETGRAIKAAIVVSGTASLEVGLLKIPQVVIYKTGYFNYILARILIKVRFISLVNLILNKKVISELIQNECTKSNILRELEKINQPETLALITDNYKTLKASLVRENTYQSIAKKLFEMAS